jgi:hypothetical protein
MSSRPNLWHRRPAQARRAAARAEPKWAAPGKPAREALARPAQADDGAFYRQRRIPAKEAPAPAGRRGRQRRKSAPPPCVADPGLKEPHAPPAGRGNSERAAKEHRPRAAEVIAGKTITTHCLACGHRGDLNDGQHPGSSSRPRPWASSSAGSAATDAAHRSRGSGCKRRRGLHLTWDRARIEPRAPHGCFRVETGPRHRTPPCRGSARSCCRIIRPAARRLLVDGRRCSTAAARGHRVPARAAVSCLRLAQARLARSRRSII